MLTSAVERPLHWPGSHAIAERADKKRESYLTKEAIEERLHIFFRKDRNSFTRGNVMTFDRPICPISWAHDLVNRLQSRTVTCRILCPQTHLRQTVLR